jgi:hypothetical protein
VADGPGSMCFTREQGVGDPISYDFVVAVLIGWLPRAEVVASSPTPQWEEALAQEIFFQPCKEVIDKVLDWNYEVFDPIREDEQSNGIGGQVR